ncbi:hypothetical protein COU77_00665 [Candidatus Peregrinibacteria bacterium CG10_big_fil_rev_8_21_14_0_10_49_16]|nr:MAG: hypothetical protein COW95_04610 [Candidatus Peregrinibacteria bacterium CG22_combo_CG10-13_8_21_14_all_49_11]PIR52376.1 MAG: hypothetical protein COU77_00665 [Candidatus Peregrinibacteria bacterium CG10_big_fil_rev_8_21_14_0_10_49_16]
MENFPHKRKLIIGGICASVALVLFLIVFNMYGSNDDQNWQVIQGIDGTVAVRDQPGWYFQGFATVWTWPRAMEARYDQDGTDERLGVTFNDGGKAQVECYVRYQLPVKEEDRRKLHRDFSGNPEHVKGSIRNHLVNCIKISGPLMSASEHQAARKAEFTEVVGDQLRLGLYKMKKVTRVKKLLPGMPAPKDGGVDNDQISESVLATEIVLDKDGKPVVIEESPLKQYGIMILQFSIGDTDYDAQTLEQFAEKKKSYLAAERAKAQQMEEISQRLMVIEKGKREVAEIEAEANKKKMKATVEAQQLLEVAKINRDQSVIEAMKKVQVAEKLRMEEEELKKIAAIKVDTAKLEKDAEIERATAKQKLIEIGGQLSEKERVLAEIKANRDVEVAKHLAQIKVPGVVIMGGSGSDGKAGTQSAQLQENLMNLLLLRHAGVLDDPKKVAVPQK